VTAFTFRPAIAEGPVSARAARRARRDPSFPHARARSGGPRLLGIGILIMAATSALTLILVLGSAWCAPDAARAVPGAFR
jgi:hypothetical protein